MTSRRLLLALGESAADRALGDQLLNAVRSPDGCVVHRCEDLEELLVTAATGVAEAAVVSPYVARLDREALARLAALGVAAVGIAADERGEQRLRLLGVDDVLPRPPDARGLESAVARALARSRSTVGFAHATAGPVLHRRSGAGRGRVVAVWGPTGAPGRSTVAVGLASELAALGWPTLLVDADVYGGSLAAAVGAPEEAAGLAAACRAANLGALDLSTLEGLVVEVGPGLSVLTGIDRAERWPELRPAAVEVVLELARNRAAVTVVDCGFSLEQDEELSYDTLAPRRNGATLAALADADLVVVVGRADRLGLRRLVTALGELREALPEARTAVVCNGVRATAVPEPEVRATLRRLAGVEPVACLPWDGASLDEALGRGRPLAADSSLRLAFEQLAAQLVGSRRG